jgi:hypothetical protein
MESHSQKLHDAMEVHARQLREEMAGRDRVTDGRIQEMVSAIGQFIDKASELTTNLTNRTLPHKDISEKPL